MRISISTKGRQQGVALLLAIVALLLITAAGLALMFSSDTETAISVNYRDKQVAIYAALAGLEEARNRIHPSQGDLKADVPQNLPSSGSPNVLYIINPRSGETIEPWNPSNAYYDPELCQENVLGMTQGTPGVPCPASSLPSGNWYKAVYNTSGTWNLGTPLSYKWVRVTLKHSNMTPVTVGTGGNKQVCWNGNGHEQIIPAGYTTKCTPQTGGVTNVKVLTAGSGYASTPTVTFSGGDGSGAAAEAIVGPLPSAVIKAELTDPGDGYTSAVTPTVIPTNGGYGALISTQIGSAQPVNSITLQNAAIPACFSPGTQASAFNVGFNPSSTPSASGQVTLMTGARCIYSFTVDGCSNSGGTTHNLKGVTLTDGNGFKGTFNTDNSGKVVGGSFSVLNPGNGNYSGGTSYSVTQPSGGTCTVSNSSVHPNYGIQIAAATASGGKYTSAPSVNFNGPVAINGNGSTSGTANLAGSPTPGPLTDIWVAQGGSDYLAAPQLVFPDPPASSPTRKTATGVAYIADPPTNGVIGVKITNSGSGYRTNNPPTVTIGAPGSGTTATAVASVGSSAGSLGNVYMLTALAQTNTGARAVVQMEVGVEYEIIPLTPTGALTMGGPSPVFTSPNSQNFFMDGADHAASASYAQPTGCNKTKQASLPAIGVYDDPNNPTSPTAQTSVTQGLGKPANYIGAGTSPSVKNIYGSLANATPATLNGIADSFASVGGAYIQGSRSSPVSTTSIDSGSPTNPATNVVYGNFTMTGNRTGYGTLVVTGTLTMSGDWHWNGIIVVIGQGAGIFNGGGNAQINGTVFIANTNGGSPPGSELASPTVQFSGGGGNGIYYDHCWVDDLLKNVPWTPTPASSELKVISLRVLDI